MKDISVIFLGGSPTSLAGIRALSGKNNIKTYVITGNRFELSRYSKYTTYLGNANPQYEGYKIIDLLLSFSKKNNNSINILVPTGDEYVEFLSKNKDLLYKKYKASLFENDISNVFLNKKNFSNLCIENKLNYPKTWFYDSEISIKSWANGASYPCFVKPVYYHKWKEQYGLKKGFLAHNETELISIVNKVSSTIKEIIVQEVVEGEDDQIVIFTGNFNANGYSSIFTGRKLRQFPYKFGTTTCAVSENINEIIEPSIKFLLSLKFIGVCDVEYKYDKNENVYKIIEINPRIGRWYSLVTRSGKNPLLDSVYYLAGISSISNSQEQINGIIWLFPFRDIFVLFKNKNIKFTKTIKYYLSFNKTWCVFKFSDPLPFFMYFFEIISKSIIYHIREKKNSRFS